MSQEIEKKKEKKQKTKPKNPPKNNNKQSWYISIAEYKTAVTPLLMHWSYYSLALS